MSLEKILWNSIEYTTDFYNQSYEKYPAATKFISTAVGTVGGDFIAKRISEGEDITLRDVAFTASAALYQAWLYPKFLDFTDKIVEKPAMQNTFNKLKISKGWAKSIVLGGMFFVPNMFYWGLLTYKNQNPITVKGANNAAKSIAIGSIPYLGIDYIVANKVSKKYCLPIWAGAELAYNTFLAAVAYLA